MKSRRLKRWTDWCVKRADRWWYAPAVALLSALDAYLLVVPNEPIIAASVIARPDRWRSLTAWMTLGNTIGAVSLAALVQWRSDWILRLLVSQSMLESHSWRQSVLAINRFGAWGLGLISLSPLPQHAAVILVGLARMPLKQVFLGVLLGRAPKYFGVAWLAVKSPGVLRRWKMIS